MSPKPEPSQADDETASALEAVLAEVFPEPQLKPESQPSKVAVGKEAFLAAYTPVAKEVADDLGISQDCSGSGSTGKRVGQVCERQWPYGR